MFEKNKDKALKILNEHLKQKRVDEALIDFLLQFNKKENFYTSSSCSGRIIILLDKGKKKESKIIAKWHRKVDFNEFLNVYKNLDFSVNGKYYLKQEPLILHVICKKLKDALKILKLCRKHGFKHSGIISAKKEKIVVEINGIDYLSVPLASNMSEEYLKFVLEVANRKFEKNEERSKKFLSELLKI